MNAHVQYPHHKLVALGEMQKENEKQAIMVAEPIAEGPVGHALQGSS